MVIDYQLSILVKAYQQYIDSIVTEHQQTKKKSSWLKPPTILKSVLNIVTSIKKSEIYCRDAKIWLR
jgi:hypothetical protein